MTPTEKTKEDQVGSRKGAHHQSSLETILDGCSWQYYLGNVLEVPQPEKPHSLVGTSFHSAIEHHEVSRLNGNQLPTLKEMQEVSASLITEKFELVPKEMLVGKDGSAWTLDTLVGMSSDALESWFKEKPKGDSQSHREWLLDREPVEIEKYFNVKLLEGSLPIAGWIDGIYKDTDGSIILVDQKTAGDFSRWKADGEGHRYQATMYCVGVLLSDDYPEIDSLDKLSMTYLVSRTRGGRVERSRRVIVKPELDDVSLLGVRIRTVDDIIYNTRFAPNPTWNLCSPRFCAFYNGCQVTGELRKTPTDILRRYQ